MSLEPTPPRRALLWPPLVQRIASQAADPSVLFLVGGIVRDALLGVPTHDIDLATPENGLTIARKLANALHGSYYPVDPERLTGRAIVEADGQSTMIDVASFRDSDLVGDLRGRDFTINAMAVRLDALDAIIDPLGGQADFFDRRLLRQCTPDSISNDPIRALRAVRQSLQFRLRIEPGTKEAARLGAARLAGADGQLSQPERVRDELFRMLGGREPIAALRLLHALGLLQAMWPFEEFAADDFERRLRIVEKLHTLLTIISPYRTDQTAADLMLGIAVVVLDRHRPQLQEHFSQPLARDRSRRAVLLLGTLSALDQPPQAWANRLRLSNGEQRVLSGLGKGRDVRLPLAGSLDDRAIHRYFNAMGESGIDQVLLNLAEVLASQQPAPDPERWGDLLEQVASPLLDAYFRRHQEVVAPLPLLTGDDLMQRLSLEPGPAVGRLLNRLIEEQAAGTVRTKKGALQLTKRLLEEEN